jgi:hypothetical protein
MSSPGSDSHGEVAASLEVNTPSWKPHSDLEVQKTGSCGPAEDGGVIIHVRG